MAEFQFRCPQCGEAIEADETLRGQMAECPYCGKNIAVPNKCLRKVAVRHDSTVSSRGSSETEKTILTTQPNPINFFPVYIIFSLIAIGSLIIASLDSEGLSGGVVPAIGNLGFLVSLVVIVSCVLYCNTTKYTITNMRVIVETGILSTSTTTVRITDIRAIFLRRNLLQQMNNLASIVIATAATGSAEITIFGIPEWKRVEEILRNRQNSTP